MKKVIILLMLSLAFACSTDNEKTKDQLAMEMYELAMSNENARGCAPGIDFMCTAENGDVVVSSGGLTFQFTTVPSLEDPENPSITHEEIAYGAGLTWCENNAVTSCYSGS